MEIKLLNTLSGEKETLLKEKSKTIKLFVCGPTVYYYLHIGNARVFIFFDVLSQYLKHKGYKLFYLQNITDVDDKIIARAKEEKTTWKKIAGKYEKKNQT